MPCSYSFGTNEEGSPNSWREQIIPWDSTPLNFPRLILCPPAIRAPWVATIIFCPLAIFGAPQTICKDSSPATSTVTTCRWSESGWSTTSNARPTTNPLSPSPGTDTLSTSIPVRDIFSPNSWGVIELKSKYSFNHSYDNFIFSSPYFVNWFKKRTSFV